MFKDHHYLSGDINKAARCFVGVWDDQVVAFGASLALPSGNFKNGWKGHRTVVLPDFQGLGIGVRFSDGVAQIHLEQGLRYYSRTAHPRMIYYREQSLLWKPTTKHKKIRIKAEHKTTFNGHHVDYKRLCGSFQYIGQV